MERREIRFRGISKETNEFLFGSLLVIGKRYFISSQTNQEQFEKFESNNKINHELIIGRNFKEVKPETVGQFTGLKDKNGSGDICLYEGDILSLDGTLKGNIHVNTEMDKRKSDIVIEKIGTKAWRSSEKKAMDRGFGYPF